VDSGVVYQARPISLAHWKLCRQWGEATPTSSEREKWV